MASPGADLKLGQRRRAAVRTGPEQMRAVADEPRLRRDEPDEHRERGDARRRATPSARCSARRSPAQRCARRRARRRPAARETARRSLPCRRTFRDAAGIRERLLRPSWRRARRVRREKGMPRPKTAASASATKSTRRAPVMLPSGERQGAQREREDDRRAERGADHDGRSARQRAEPQTTLEPGDVGVELLSRAHRASHVKIPRVGCPDTGWPATTRPAPPSAPAALCTTTH